MAVDHSKRRPLVSVVVPVYNRENLVYKTLDSLKKQTYRPIQLVIVDDGSKDGTVAVLDDFKAENEGKDFSIIIYEKNNSGAPSARNAGIKLSEGTYLQFLDSDDMLSPDKINIQVKALEESGADMAICDFRYIHPDQSANRVVRNEGDLIKKISQGWSVSIFSPLIRRSIFFNRIWWDEKLKRQQDIDFMFKVFCLSSQYVYTPGAMCDYIHHDCDQISDQYKTKSPQFFRRASSLICFWVKNTTALPRGRYLMVFKGVGYIARSFHVFWAKKILTSLVGEPLSRKIYSYLKGG